MEQYAIKNTDTNMWVQDVVSGSEIVQTNRSNEALLFEREEEAQALSKRLTLHRGYFYQVTSVVPSE